MSSAIGKSFFKHIINCLGELTSDHLPRGTHTMVTTLVANMIENTEYNGRDVTVMILYALCLLDKLARLGYKLTGSTINLLFQTAVIVSSEFLDDEPYDVHLWVNIFVSGVTDATIRTLKNSFLDHLGWDVQVSSKDFKNRCPPGFQFQTAC
ncbi:hypothetical protein GL50803_0017241 [Giardia duodenalis]|uniref:Uncharacterized protein n=2 Tax=Giardia intestinalis TaxID=5741 RepID=A8BLK5_GIAIC|nr:hypothetical protein GL50803_0017241 [Giardia intestinalis]ESU38153.1 Hypothetical protein DHA2_17241 [Giardia intestinalis]KAE8302777.1 hypothetical protein GL50803_0017241 [Giardia intestinalis]|eukprot:XP_001706313.1 Hypothetical protein GL50803_17241 [Giardia lamblia ATCC 50803]